MEEVLAFQELKFVQSDQVLNGVLDKQSGKELILELVTLMLKTSRRGSSLE